MDITLNNVSKRYGYQTILKNINLSIPAHSAIGIKGRNGSGKSTLLKIIASYLSPSSGQISFTLADKKVLNASIATMISIAAPYVKITQELTLREAFDFNNKFKPMYNSPNFEEFLAILDMGDTKQKEIRQFSSGMQQKVNLAFALLANTQLLILDEPTSYLDSNAKDWFFNLFTQFQNNRTTVMASNDKLDFQGIEKIVEIQDGLLI